MQDRAARAAKQGDNIWGRKKFGPRGRWSMKKRRGKGFFLSEKEKEKEDGVEKGGKGGRGGQWEEKGGNLLKKENVTIAEQMTNDK